MTEGFERVRQTGPSRLCVLLGLLALLFVLPRSAAAGSRGGVQTSGAESRFVIADFDGDVLPDFASIRGDLNSSGGVNYWIQLQLSGTGQQSIHLVGPAGGLSIESRDVNGDHIPDLLLATEWSGRPVAILLNDGHGNFSRVAPDKFPSAFATSNQNWSSVAHQVIDLCGLPSQSRASVCTAGKGPHRGRSPTARIASPTHFFHSQFLFSASAGRAPPPNAAS
jgi:hypothetical protein